MHARRLSTAFLVAVLSLSGCAPAQSNPQPAPVADGVQRVALDIRTAKGLLHYEVEIAATPQEQARGLMYRTSLPPRGGMIFPMTPPRPASFWMKNTYIPLDMIFIRTDGRIARIAANTVPESLAPVESGEPVAAVLEIAGGRAAAEGIAEGDVVRWNR